MEKKVQRPAIALLVVVVLTVLWVAAGPIVGDWVAKLVEQADLPEDQRQQLLEHLGTSQTLGPVQILFLGLKVIGLALIAWGAWRMRHLRSYGLAMTASILAMIPCFSDCCCLIGLPVGIWSLIVLLDKDVKAAFAGASAAQPPGEPPPL
jgi:hypothetical protein